MLPDWENMERLLGTDTRRLFLDFPFPWQKKKKKRGKSRDPINNLKMRWFWWMQRSFITFTPACSLVLSVACFFFCLRMSAYTRRMSLFPHDRSALKSCGNLFQFKNKNRESKVRIMSSWTQPSKAASVILLRAMHIFSTADGTSMYNQTQLHAHKTHKTNSSESKNNDWLVLMHVIPAWPSLAHKWTGLAQPLL